MRIIKIDRIVGSCLARCCLARKLSHDVFFGIAAAVAFILIISPALAAPKWEVIAAWHMNENTGAKMRDAAGVSAATPDGRSPGTLHNVRLGLAGVKGGAYGFDGTSSYVIVPHSDLFDFGTRSIRVRLHLKTSIFGHSSAGDDLIKSGYYLRSSGLFKVELYPDGRISCAFKGTKDYTGDIFSLSSVVTPPPAKPVYHTIACVLDQAIKQARVVVDGVIEATRTVDVGAIFNREPIMIGAYPAAGYYNGLLDEVTIQAGTCVAAQCPIDGLTYIASYADLIQTLGANAAAGQQHYLQYGQAQGRKPYLFNAVQYLANYPELKAAFGSDTQAATLHYIQEGYAEGRTDIDVLRYIASYGDLIGAFGIDEFAGLQHYVHYGKLEKRDPYLFNPLQYLSNYPDLRAGFGTDTRAAATHFIQYGYFEHRTDKPL
jgi:hypothetical protein